MILKSRFFDYLIVVFCLVVFGLVGWIRSIRFEGDLPFDRFLFSDLCAVINASVLFLLFFAVRTVRRGNTALHRLLMKCALLLSSFFLLFYLLHHYFAGETLFGGNGTTKIVYLCILFTHIIASALALPAILWTALFAYRSELQRHKKWVRLVYPLWMYVSISGLIVYAFISPYYLRG